MTTYNIKPYSYHQAKQLSVDIIPSTRKNKKIDIYKSGKYLYSIGDIRYNDYPTYIQMKGQEYADKRRLLYHRRHENDNVSGTAGYYALRILW